MEKDTEKDTEKDSQQRRVFSTRLDPVLYQKLRLYSVKHQVYVTDIARQAFEEFLRNHQED